MTESEFEYGPRAGLPRLLRLFKQFGYTATVDAGELLPPDSSELSSSAMLTDFFSVSAAIDKSPYWAKELVEARFEIACASKRWIDYMMVAPEEEEKHIAEAIDSLEKLTGAVPRGEPHHSAARKFTDARRSQATAPVGVLTSLSGSTLAPLTSVASRTSTVPTPSETIFL